MKTNLIYGHYTCLTTGIQYEYDATWRAGPSGLTWSASACLDGSHASHLTGMMHSADAAAGESAVHEAIERAIERQESLRRPAVIERRVSAVRPQRANRRRVSAARTQRGAEPNVDASRAPDAIERRINACRPQRAVKRRMVWRSQRAIERRLASVARKAA